MGIFWLKNSQKITHILQTINYYLRQHANLCGWFSHLCCSGNKGNPVPRWIWSRGIWAPSFCFLTSVSLPCLLWRIRIQCDFHIPYVGTAPHYNWLFYNWSLRVFWIQSLLGTEKVLSSCFYPHLYLSLKIFQLHLTLSNNHWKTIFNILLISIDIP